MADKNFTPFSRTCNPSPSAARRLEILRLISGPAMRRRAAASNYVLSQTPRHSRLQGIEPVSANASAG